MKKISILAVAVFGAAMMTSCGMGSASVKTEEDSLAYAIGVDVGHMVFGFDSTMNPDIVASAVKDVFAKKESMTRQEAAAYIQEYMTVGVARKNAEEGKKFLEEAVKNGAQQTESGLVYKIEKPGSDRKIQLGDSLYAFYKLSLPNGQVLGETFGGDENPDPFLLEEPLLIQGWLQGLPLIGEGGKIQLYVPSNLAYGENGRGNIRGNQALKFDIEVTKVIPQPKTEAAQ